jgi:hypothetical protein
LLQTPRHESNLFVSTHTGSTVTAQIASGLLEPTITGDVPPIC